MGSLAVAVNPENPVGALTSQQGVISLEVVGLRL